MTPTQIRKLRKKLGLSLDKFAAECGLTGKHRGRNVLRWERGKFKPSGPVLMLMKKLKP